MNELFIIYAAIFGAVFLGAQAVGWIYSERKHSHAAVNRRLDLAGGGADNRDVFEALKRERGLAGLENDSLRALNRFLTQTGIRLDDRRILWVGFMLSVFILLCYAAVFGLGIVAFIAGVLTSIGVLVLAAVWVRHRRIAKFLEQMPDAIDVVVRGVRAGHPFAVSLGLVSKEMADPVGSEFGITCDEIAFGADVSSALTNLELRVGEPELNYLRMAIKVQTETGGNLAEVLSRLTTLMRARATLRLKVRALSAEGRISAVFLSLSPFVLFGMFYLISPGYFSTLNGSPVLVPSLVIGALLLLIGNFIIYRLVNFKV